MMRHQKLAAFYGLKWNPFTADVPTHALWTPPAVTSFCRRVDNLCGQGGFALVTGEPGSGKTVALRLLAEHLDQIPEVTVGILARPQSGLADFYRELGDLFGVELRPHNRWCSFKGLRQRWLAQAESSLVKPILLIDEAQETFAPVLSELRILASGPFETQTYLTVVLAGDSRLLTRLSTPDLLPLSSRIRTRLACDHATRQQLQNVLTHALQTAGNPSLIKDSLQEILVEHAGGNYRSLMTMAGELLLAAHEKEEAVITEDLFFELYQQGTDKKRRNR
jgi:type II secretory pathway predicted ATPase ExeA